MIVTANLVSPMNIYSLWAFSFGSSAFIKSTDDEEHPKFLQIHSKVECDSGRIYSFVMLHKRNELYNCIILIIFTYFKNIQQILSYVETTIDLI